MNLKKFLSLLLTISITLISSAQAPIFQWANSMGGASNDLGTSVTVDASGNVYSTGIFYGTVDFDPGTGIFNLAAAGYHDIFISKFDAGGNFVWAKSIGGITPDQSNSITNDALGNVYITGSFSGIIDFDPGPGTYTQSAASADYFFILKLDAAGNFVWAIPFGKGYGFSIGIDAANNIYTTGRFYGVTDFDPGPGTFTIDPSGSEMFISKLDPSGNFVWAKNFGGIGANGIIGYSIAFDSFNNVYTTGEFGGEVDFDPGAGTFTLNTATPSSLANIFVSKLDASGNFVWAKHFSGTHGGKGYSLNLDGANNVYITGQFHSTVDFDPGPGTYTLNGGGFQSIFISKLNSSGNFIWAKQFVGANGHDGYGLAIDQLGYIYTTGSFGGTADFDPGINVFNLTSPGGVAAFVSKLDSAGNFIWATHFGGTTGCRANAIKLDASGNIYTTGWYSGTVDFDMNTATYNLTSNAFQDIFVHKMSQTPNGIKKENVSNYNIKIYPNPNSGKFKLQIDDRIENGKIVLFNSIGQRIYEQKIIQGVNEINTIGISKGLYNYMLFQGQQQITQGKLLIE